MSENESPNSLINESRFEVKKEIIDLHLYGYRDRKDLIEGMTPEVKAHFHDHFPDGKIKVTTVEKVIDYKGANIMTACRFDYEVKDEQGKTKPYITLSILGGGSSGALDNISLTARIVDACEISDYPFPYSLRIITLPHVGGAPRIDDDLENNKFTSLDDSSEILLKLLKVKELGVYSDDVAKGNLLFKMGIIGYSAGGTQGLSLAAKMKDSCQFIALIDSPGIIDNKSVKAKFMASMFYGYFKYAQIYKNPLSILKAVGQEFSNAWVTSDGALESLNSLIKDSVKDMPKNNIRLAKKYGLDKEKLGKYGKNLALLNKQIPKYTREKITADIINIPTLGSMIENLSQTAIEKLSVLGSPKKLMKKGLDDIDLIRISEYTEKSMREIFPNAKSVICLPNLGMTHSTFMTDELITIDTMEAIKSILKEKDPHKLNHKL